MSKAEQTASKATARVRGNADYHASKRKIFKKEKTRSRSSWECRLDVKHNGVKKREEGRDVGNCPQMVSRDASLRGK